jgi:hypothetical protein
MAIKYIMTAGAIGVIGCLLTTALGQNAASAQNLTATPTLSEATMPDAVQVAPAQNLASIPVRPGAPQLTLTRPGGTSVHIFPTVSGAAKGRALPFADTGPLLYHKGGSIMPTITVTPIFWVPAHLQNGGVTSMSSDYKLVQEGLASRYPGHGIANNNTQYYQVINSNVAYIQNAGSYAGFATDNIAYPRSTCMDRLTPGNCITDAQVQTELARVINTLHFTAGLNRIFLLYTSSGEGSCFASDSKSCAYTEYCAYHGHFTLGGTPVIYGNQPYGDMSSCQLSGTPSPNADPVADATASTASHEITEAITDPLLNAWYTSQGNEIGDLCAYTYGSNTWISNHGIPANQFWSGTTFAFFELQQEFDNHQRKLGNPGCVQIGPQMF